MADSESTGEKKPKKPLPQAFTPLTAKQAQEASVRSRNLRKQMRAQLLDAAVHDAKIGDLFVQAFKKKDMDLLELVEKGMKLTGLDFASSEEAVQKMEVKSDSKLTTSGPINITFTDPKPKKES